LCYGFVIIIRIFGSTFAADDVCFGATPKGDIFVTQIGFSPSADKMISMTKQDFVDDCVNACSKDTNCKVGGNT
jgi:hypothetical protein